MPTLIEPTKWAVATMENELLGKLAEKGVQKGTGCFFSPVKSNFI